jgi:hypothetical protein
VRLLDDHDVVAEPVGHLGVAVDEAGAVAQLGRLAEDADVVPAARAGGQQDAVVHRRAGAEADHQDARHGSRGWLASQIHGPEAKRRQWTQCSGFGQGT